MNLNKYKPKIFLIIIPIVILAVTCNQKAIPDKNNLIINAPGKVTFSVNFNPELNFICSSHIPKKISLLEVASINEYSRYCISSSLKSLSVYCAYIDWQDSSKSLDSSPFLATFDNIDSWNDKHLYASDFIPDSDSLIYRQYLILNFRESESFIVALEDKILASPGALQELYSRGAFFKNSIVKDITLY